LDFPWSHLLGEASRVAWLYESEGRRGDEEIARRRRWWLTSWRALRPRRFWRAIDLATPMNRGRLVRFAVLWLALVHVACAAASAGYAAYDMYFAGSGYARFYTRDYDASVFGWALRPFELVPRIFDEEVPLWWMFFVPLSWFALTPVVFLVLGQTLGRAKVRRRHILRGVCYAPPWCVVVSAALPAAYIGAAFAQSYGYAPGGTALVDGGMLGAVLLVFAAMVWWWRCFAHEYLRIRHTWGVALTAVVAAGLMVAIVMVVAST
jgi:hypothetical protein